MLSYQKIVFGLKEHRRLYECWTFMEWSRSLRCIISEHDSFADDCERTGLHYHGILEHKTAENVFNNEALVQLRMYCAYFKMEKCVFPRQFLTDLTKPPKKVMILEILNSFYLGTFYTETSNAAAIMCEGQYEKEVSKMHAMENIIAIINERRIFDHVELQNLIEINNYVWTPDEYKKAAIDAITLVRQKMLNQSILELCDYYVERSENYFTLEESIDLILEWCLHQNINIVAFTMDWISCLNKQVSFKNTIYFDGAHDSGVKSIVNSIAEACTFVGKVDNESTGYAYVWEDCVEKRCIVMQDPVFNDRMVEILENIFRGIGTYVRDRRNGLEFLRPTPVILICYNRDLERHLYLKQLQSSFINSYVDLKPFLKLHADSRLLHPDWLNFMYQHFTDTRVDPIDSEDSREDEMDSDSSFDSSDGDATSCGPIH